MEPQDNDWLREHSKQIHSQFGEEGILEKALELIGVEKGWCVEFGAWDGKLLSNTYHFIQNGYSAVLIEGSEQRYDVLKRNFKEYQSVIPVNAFVGFERNDNLDTILEKTPIPEDFDLLSIDIDGNDYHVWDAMTKYRPKLVIIEYNPTIPNEIEFVQEKNFSVSQGSSARSMNELAKSKGYELISTTVTNAIFVDKKYFHLFGIQDNSLSELRKDISHITYVFNGYDGTVFMVGSKTIHWHGIHYKEKKLQLVPKYFRGYPGSYSKLKTILAGLYRYVILREKWPTWKEVRDHWKTSFGE